MAGTAARVAQASGHAVARPQLERGSWPDHLLATIAGVDLRTDVVDEAMSTDAYAVAPDVSVGEVSAHMAAHRDGCAVVIERGRVIGVFTTTDALRALSRSARDRTRVSLPDARRLGLQSRQNP